MKMKVKDSYMLNNYIFFAFHNVILVHIADNMHIFCYLQNVYSFNL